MKKFARCGIFALTMAITILLILPAAQAVDFAISGHINRAGLWGDNGNDDDVKFVDNETSNSRFRFTGSNTFDEAWTVGITWEDEKESNTSSSTDIDIGANTDTSDVTFTERKMEFYVDHKKFGKLYLGQGDTASNSTSEVDLSGTDVVNDSSISDMAGGFTFRTGDDDLVPRPSIGSVFSNFDGFSRRDRIRYDTPTFYGFFASTSYMNGQSWDVALRYAGEWEGFGKLAAAGHYTGAETQRDPYSQYSGSISFLHSSGISLTGAVGSRDYEDSPTRFNEDTWSAYGKVGYQISKWALSVDYAYAEDVAQEDDEATSIGAAAVWNIWESVQFYGSYRWHELDRDNVDFNDIHAVMVGGRVKF
jgi:hypothetical protein